MNQFKKLLSTLRDMGPVRRETVKRYRYLWPEESRDKDQFSNAVLLIYHMETDGLKYGEPCYLSEKYQNLANINPHEVPFRPDRFRDRVRRCLIYYGVI